MKLKLFSIVYLVSLWLTVIHSQENKLKQNEIDEDYDDSPRFFQVNTKSGLVLREKPDRNSKKLALLPDKEKGIIVGQTKKIERIDGNEGRWFEIEYKGKQGWIFSGFVIKYTEVISDDYDIVGLDELNRGFLFLTKKPVYWDRPGGELIEYKSTENINEYPQFGEFIEIDKRKKIGSKVFLHFKMSQNGYDNFIQGWVSNDKGILLNRDQFSNYTLKLSKKNFTKMQMQYIKRLIENDGKVDDDKYFNWLDTKFLPVQFDNKKPSRKKVFILSLAFGFETRSGYGSFVQSNYIVWKEGKNFKSENINANDKMKVLDLDKDGIPEIYSTYESRGEASTCELFGYKDNSYRKIIFPTGDHYCLDMKIKPDGKIEIKENKKTLTYRYNKGNLSEVLQH